MKLEVSVKQIVSVVFLSMLCFGSLAKELTVVVGLAKPPYVIQETNSGFEIELIREVFALMAIKPEFIYVPFGRSARMLQSKGVDSIMTMNSNIIEDSYLTESYITYQNVVVTLKKNQFDINTIDDLKHVSVAAFQNANRLLGTSFAEVIMNNPGYLEVKDQRKQTTLLFDGKVDALVMDVNIFRALSPSAGGLADYSDVDIHYVFSKIDYKMAFKDTENIERFNRALSHFIRSQEYIGLVTRYKLLRQDGNTLANNPE